ncbi:hypothetical protein CN178_29340 [Sinorhizobium medicae]|nr:hypothetical protein CN178_29340 [Sinorhizobium medicae]
MDTAGLILKVHAGQDQLTAAKQGLRGGSRLDVHEAFIVGMIEAKKDITLNEMVLRPFEELRQVRLVALLVGPPVRIFSARRSI